MWLGWVGGRGGGGERGNQQMREGGSKDQIRVRFQILGMLRVSGKLRVSICVV